MSVTKIDAKGQATIEPSQGHRKILRTHRVIDASDNFVGLFCWIYPTSVHQRTNHDMGHRALAPSRHVGLFLTLEAQE